MTRLRISAVLLMVMTIITAACAQGIPEPDLIFYGAVIRRNTGDSVPQADVTWQIQNSSVAEDFIIVKAAIVNVNGQYFYIARVPLETRSVGAKKFAASLNTLELPIAPTTYSRRAKVDGLDATIVLSSGSFTLSKSSRGSIERIDLSVDSTIEERFARWLAAHSLPGDTDRNADPLGKGMTFWDQFIAGTDPTDPDSIFKLITLKPEQDGLTIAWAAIAGRNYAIERSTGLLGNFSVLVEDFAPAAFVPGPLIFSYTDSTATGPGPYFYRIKVEEP